MHHRILPLLLLLTPLPATAAEFEFKDGDRVVLIGSTLIEREQRYGYWEAALTAANPDKNITFRNLGWSGDTVWGEARAGFGTPADGYKALIDHVKAEKPTVIIVGYGTNESFAGEAGLPKFKEQLKKLLDDLAVTKAELVFLLPMKMAKMPPPLPDPSKANERLALYANAISEEANRRLAKVIDLSKLLLSALSQFGDIRSAVRYFDNGLHMNAAGYSATSASMSSLPGVSPTHAIVIDTNANTCQVFGGKLIGEFKLLRFVIKLDSVGDSILVVKGLQQNEYALKIDGQAASLSGELFGKKTRLIKSGPDIDQAEKLRQTIVAKNELYFHRWRPANVTYLFGFRKYEQGNNAVEIPKFDPLVEAKEKEIAKLRKPLEHVYELVPVKK